jgi:hypothetical protein
MLMSGLGLSIFGMICARSYELYPATLLIRAYFIVCIGAFYAMTRDPLFFVLIAIVGLGLVLTLSSYLSERSQKSSSRALEQQESLVFAAFLPIAARIGTSRICSIPSKISVLK